MASLEGTKTDKKALFGNIGLKHGIDGKSVTIVKITESIEDGGTNIVEFSDGSILNIKNGSGGKIGIDGKSAYQYAQDGGYTGTEEEFALLMSQENLQTEKVDKISIEVSKLSEENAELKGDLSNIISPNLFNPAVAKANVAISSDDGSEMNGFSGWETTDYIPVSKGEVLYFSSNNEPTPYSIGAFYDNNKNRVDSFGNPNNNNNIAVTSDGYARFSFNAPRVNLQIEKGSRTTYVPYGELKLKSDVTKVQEDLDDLNDLNDDVLNIENSIYKISDYEQATPIESFTNGSYASDGSLIIENGRYRAKYRCRNMDKIKVRCWAGGTIPLVVFFHGDTFLSAYETNNPWSGDYEEIDVPNGANYFFAQGSDSGVYTQVESKTRDFDFNVREELDTCKEELDTCKEELENVHRRITRNEKQNDFAYSTFDKTYMVLTIDDGNKYWGQVYDLCHELNIPLCVATIPENLNIAFDDTRTIKDICNLVVADGGEVLCHSYEVITSQSGDGVYKKVFHDNKKILVENGFNIRGIILGGGADYITNTEKQDLWSRRYFDYSDLHGLDTSVQYHKPRLWYANYSTIDNVKNWVDNSLALNEFVVLAMHGSDDSTSLEHISNLRTMLEYAKSKGATFTTWSYVYDNFKSTKLEERIKALENA